MAYSTISKPSLHFNTKLWTGNGGTQSITGVGFQPDFTWIKERSETRGHNLTDAVRGAPKYINSATTDAEVTSVSTTLTSFDSDGFSLGSYDDVNKNSQTYVGWNWKANGAGSANTDGTINTTVSANNTSGFSIISYTGTGGTSQTLGHGLGVKPKMFIVKCRSNAGEYWGTWIDTDGDGTSNYRMSLNATDAAYGNNPISFSNSLITLPSSANTQWDGSGRTYVGYAFAEKQGYSKFGSYTGNGSTDGTFVYLGFKPAFVIIKSTDLVKNWLTFDNLRLGYNGTGTNKQLHPNTSGTETSGNGTTLDILSNGFKTRTTDSDENGYGQNYIYMAFAEEPLVANVGASIPATAR